MESTGYYFTNKWFEFSFQNPDKISPTHTAMYLWFVQLNNKLQWVEKFASPASQTMQAIGLKSYNTYKKIFDELIGFGFIKVITESRNQYTAVIIALSKFDEAQHKANGKAKKVLPQKMIEHNQKQSEPTIHSIDSIIKQETDINLETIKTQTLFGESEAKIIKLKIHFDEFWNLYDHKKGDKKAATKKWDALTHETQKKIIELLPKFILTISDKQYQPYPTSFLNQERWNDDLTQKNKKNENKPTIPTEQKQFKL